MIMVFKKKLKTMIKIIIVIFLLQGCFFYSLSGSLPAHIDSISIAPVINESAEFSVAEILNEELNELMISENVLDIILPEQADSRLNVIITSIIDRPYTYSLSNDGMEEVEEWKLVIKANVLWYDIKRDEVLFEKNMSSWGSYTPGVDIGADGLDNDGNGLIDSEDSNETGSPRESALTISVSKLSHNIINEITNTW